MKGKRYTTEDKIRILREADAGKSILEVCREAANTRAAVTLEQIKHQCHPSWRTCVPRADHIRVAKTDENGLG